MTPSRFAIPNRRGDSDPPFVPGRETDLKILAAPASMRNAEWLRDVSFIGIVFSVICLFAGNVALMESLFAIAVPGLRRQSHGSISSGWIRPSRAEGDGS